MGWAADVTIQSNGTSYRAHKVILCARSEYFKSLFLTAGMIEQQESRVELNDLEPDVLIMFLRGLYANQVDPTFATNKDAILHLLQCCSRFQADALGTVVEHLAIELVLMESSHAADFLAQTELYDLTRLQKVCLAILHFFD